MLPFLFGLLPAKTFLLPVPLPFLFTNAFPDTGIAPMPPLLAEPPELLSTAPITFLLNPSTPPAPPPTTTPAAVDGAGAGTCTGTGAALNGIVGAAADVDTAFSSEKGSSPVFDE